MKHVLRWCAVALTATALAGCVRTTVETTIHDEETFSQHAVIAFSDDVASQVGAQAGFDLDTVFSDLEDSPELAELEAEYPGQIVIEPYDDGELEGVEMTLTELPLAELSSAASDAVAGVGGAASIEMVDDQFVVTMETPEDLNLASLGVNEGQLTLFENSVDIAVSYTFPGLVREATAGEISGNTVTLGLTDLVTSGEIRIVADSSPSIDWAPILKWGGIALAFIVVVGGAAALVWQDRRKRHVSTLPPPTTTTAPTGPGMLSHPEEPADGDEPASASSPQ